MNVSNVRDLETRPACERVGGLDPRAGGGKVRHIPQSSRKYYHEIVNMRLSYNIMPTRGYDLLHEEKPMPIRVFGYKTKGQQTLVKHVSLIVRTGCPSFLTFSIFSIHFLEARL